MSDDSSVPAFERLLAALLLRGLESGFLRERDIPEIIEDLGYRLPLDVEALKILLRLRGD